MKSAAFNLAFKVHRREITFEEGIILSDEEDAAEDFIEALNSLAGEVKYDPAELPMLLDQARSGAGVGQSQPSVPSADLENLRKEIEKVNEKKREILEGIRTLQTICIQTGPTIIPGVNSILLLVTFAVLASLLFVFRRIWLGLGIVIAGFACAGFVYAKDLRTLQEQRKEADRRRARNEAEISKLKTLLEETEKLLDAKEARVSSMEEDPSQHGIEEEKPE